MAANLERWLRLSGSLAAPADLAFAPADPALPAESARMAIAIPAPRVKVLGVETFEQPFRLRLPFRFGVITLTEGAQAVLRVRIRHEDGREGGGFAAEILAAEWFDKNPALSDAQNQHQLRNTLELARDAYLAAPPARRSSLSPTTTPPLSAGRGGACRRWSRATATPCSTAPCWTRSAASRRHLLCRRCAAISAAWRRIR